MEVESCSEIIPCQDTQSTTPKKIIFSQVWSQYSFSKYNVKFIGATFCIVIINKQFIHLNLSIDRLCGLVVRVLGYRSGGPDSIPGTTRKKK
jgi:hypothetical protein